MKILRAGAMLRRGYSTKRWTCGSCGTVLGTALPVCGRCRHIGRLDETISHHELLGLRYGPNPFVVEPGELKRRYIEAQRDCHPDRWVGQDEAVREAALVVSNAVNRAYKTLVSPMERIEYVLGREGTGVAETDRIHPELVGEVLEARERIEASAVDRLPMLAEENAEQRRDTEREIAEAVGRADWSAAKASAVRLRYLVRIEEAIEHRRTENAE